MTDLDKRWKHQLDCACALQRAIEYHCRGKEVPSHIAEKCPHHAGKLNKSLREHTKEESEMANMALELGIEKLQARTNRLERLIEGLVVEQAGNDRTFREVISDIAALARRFEELEGRLAFFTASPVALRHWTKQ